mgnify:CR=1 FL=1
MNEYYGDNIRWFVGRIISGQDPDEAGRFQVRIYGIHSEEVENKYLPWAETMLPTTEGGVSGVGKIPQLNELEWINGKIYANIYQKNGVVIINPKTGGVEVVIDFSSLKDKVTQHKGLDVLNGIAYNPETKTIFVTGKRWDKLFEVKITE